MSSLEYEQEQSFSPPFEHFIQLANRIFPTCFNNNPKYKPSIDSVLQSSLSHFEAEAENTKCSKPYSKLRRQVACWPYDEELYKVYGSIQSQEERQVAKDSLCFFMLSS